VATLATALALAGCTSGADSLPTAYPPAHVTDHPAATGCGTRSPAPSRLDPPVTEYGFSRAVNTVRVALPASFGGWVALPAPPGGRTRLGILTTNVRAAQAALATVPRRYCYRIKLYRVTYPMSYLERVVRKVEKDAGTKALVINQHWPDPETNRVEIELPRHDHRCTDPRTFDPAANYHTMKGITAPYGAAVVIRVTDRGCVIPA